MAADPVEEAAGRLYGLPLEDFTRERDARARELRKAKERGAATAVGKLPKPSQAAWAANQLARERRELVDALLEAGAALRAAQDAALAGRGAKQMRDAAAAERTAVDAAVAAAKELRPAGRRPTAATLDRLRTLLHAAAGDDGVRAALEGGRLVEDAADAGAWGLLGRGDDAEQAEPREPEPERKPKPKPKRETAKQREAREAEARAAAEREAAEREERRRLEAELKEARADRRARERELTRAEREAERAEGRLEDAVAAAEEARSDLDAARTAASEARDQVARLEERLD